MRQFEVRHNISASRLYAPFVVVMQSHLLEAMPTVLVAPMLRGDGRQVYTKVSLSIAFQGNGYVLSVGELVTVDVRLVGGRVGSVVEHEDEIRRALDRLFTGF